jgi:Spx/MgsR family transcriptional regulator
MIKIHGIPNCDTVKKARAWLQEHGLSAEFHDFKKQGLSPEMIDRWLATQDWTVLINRKGTTWRGLDDATKAAVNDEASAKALALSTPSVVKRPVVEWDSECGGGVTVGFDAEAWAQRL